MSQANESVVLGWQMYHSLALVLFSELTQALPVEEKTARGEVALPPEFNLTIQTLLHICKQKADSIQTGYLAHLPCTESRLGNIGK